MCIDAYVTIQLCLVCVHSLITRSQLKKMSVMYELDSYKDTLWIVFKGRNAVYIWVCAWCNHFPIYYLKWVLLQYPTRNNFEYSHKVQFSKGVLGKISAILQSCIMKKVNLEVMCKRNGFGYWNLCKCLPNFIYVAVLLEIQITQTRPPPPPKHFGWKKCQHPSKIRKYWSNVHKIAGAHLQLCKVWI